MDNKENLDNNTINCEIDKIEKSKLDYKLITNNDNILSKEKYIDKDSNNQADLLK